MPFSNENRALFPTLTTKMQFELWCVKKYGWKWGMLVDAFKILKVATEQLLHISTWIML